MSTVSDEIGDDWKEFDGLEVVTLHRQSSQGLEQIAISYEDADGVTQGGALRRQATHKDAIALGLAGLTGAEVIFELPVSLVGSSGVRQGNLIVDEDNVTWSVNVAQLATMKTRWRCLVTRQET